MVFQDPRAHVNPVRRIGDFMTETLRLHGIARVDAGQRRGRGRCATVGIDDGERRLAQYPHELSGGLLQRVMIAAALLGEPRLVLADEPTTALDVTTQAEVMAILDELRRERGLALLFITHDLELAAAVCDRIAVMYAGQIVETNAARPARPRPAASVHRRARGRPARHRGDRAPARGDPGHGPVSAFEAPDGCAFAPRCVLAQDACRDRAAAARARSPAARCAAGAPRELRGRVAEAMSRRLAEVSHA